MKYRENFKLVYQGKPSYEINNERETVKCHLTVKIVTPDSLYANKIMDTTVITANGYSKCDDKDTFSVEVGKKIALARAESLAYHKAEVLINKCVYEAYNFIDSAEMFCEKSNFVQAHNRNYVRKNFGPWPTSTKLGCEKKNTSYKNQPRDSMGRFMPKDNVNDCCKTVEKTCENNNPSNGIALKINRNYSNKK